MVSFFRNFTASVSGLLNMSTISPLGQNHFTLLSYINTLVLFQKIDFIKAYLMKKDTIKTFHLNCY